MGSVTDGAPTEHVPADWRKGPANTAPDIGLHEAFERVAGERPTSVALREGSRHLTFAELSQRSDAWASSLQARGLRPGDVAAIVLPRSTELVVAILAVLKCGAAYAIPDPAWPSERIEASLDLMRAAQVVAASGTALARDVWRVDEAPTAPVAGFDPVHTGGDAPASVLFTSGTTGGPKCVLTTHRAMMRLCQTNSFLDLTSPVTLPLAAPPAWDMFGLELWFALLSGGTSVVVTDPFLSAAALRHGIASQGVDGAWLTSSLFNLLVDDDIESFAGLAQVVIGGERVSPKHVRHFVQRHPDIRLVNGYGPVESVVFATARTVTESDCDRPGGVPIGLPLPGTSVHVLDGDEVCPIGVTGEICIAGDGLAVEYMGDTERTRHAFPTLVVDGRPTRLYRTGDLGAWAADGILTYGGRADRQLKVRGNRVEPAEVERQIEQVPGVVSCRVVAQCDATGAVVALAAFCVPETLGDALDWLPARLADRLPAHQLPRSVLAVERFPLNDRGKIDDRALQARLAGPTPEASSSAGTLDAQADSAGKSIDDTVADGFRGVLARTDLPRSASLFEMGGTSLDAARLCARLSARLDRPVPLSMIYGAPSIDALAARLRGIVEAPEATDSDDEGLTSMQATFLVRHLADPDDRTNVCVLLWRVPGRVDTHRLQAALELVHERHEALGSIYLLDPQPMALPLGSAAPTLQVIEGIHRQDEGVRALVDAVSDGLDPSRAVVWRAAVASVEGDTLLGCGIHHIAFDGASEAILAHEIGAAYGDPTIELPEIPLQAHADPRVDPQLVEATLAEFTGVRPLAWPEAANAEAPAGAAQAELSLTREQVAAVDRCAADHGCTRFVVLLTAWARTLAQVVGQDDFAIGVPVSQRTDARRQSSVGCHITTVPLRLRGAALTGDLSAVAQAVASGFARQDVPLTHLLGRAERDGARPPLFQTLFALQDNPAPTLDLDGRRALFLRPPYPDLTLELHAEVWVEGDGLRLVVTHLPRCVPSTTVEQLLAAFPAVLAGVRT